MIRHLYDYISTYPHHHHHLIDNVLVENFYYTYYTYYTYNTHNYPPHLAPHGP